MKNSSDNSWMDRSVFYHPCPKCKSGTLDTRIARGKIVKHLFFWMDVKRYKCSNCFAKVYVRNKAN